MPVAPLRNRPTPTVWIVIAMLHAGAIARAHNESPSAPPSDAKLATLANVPASLAEPRVVPEPTPTPGDGQEAPKPPAPAVKIGGTWYLSYQGLDADPSAFLIKRGYINIETRVLPNMSARITPDVTLDSTGDLKVRLKYAYAKFHAPNLGFLTRPEVEAGVVHMPWLDFEEHINLYRMQDTMFMERNGLFNSADFGLTFMALLGGTVADDYQKSVSQYYPGRWGSIAFGMYNGGGYHAAEKNDNKVVEGRLTIRPLADVLPGLQLSLFALKGKGNTAAAPDWQVNAAMASYQCRRFVLTAQWTDAIGNQKGTALSPLGRSLERDGASMFVEGRLTPRWSVILRHDTFDPDNRTGGDENNRTITGLAYHLGNGNTVLLDLDRLSYDDPTRPSITRLQLTLQVKY